MISAATVSKSGISGSKVRKPSAANDRTIPRVASSRSLRARSFSKKGDSSQGMLRADMSIACSSCPARLFNPAHEGKPPQALPRQLEEGIGHRGSDRRDARLAEAPGRFGGGHDVDLHPRPVVAAQGAVVVEVRLHDLPLVE